MVLSATFKTISMISWRSENLRSRCTTLCECQLSDDRFNNKLDKDPTKQFSNEITNELNNMYDNGDIDDKALEYLIPDSPIFFLKSTKPITQVDQLFLLTVIPLKKSQDLWIFTFVNVLMLFHLLSKIPLTTYKKWQL